MRAERVKRYEFSFDPKYKEERDAHEYLASLPAGTRASYIRRAVMDRTSGKQARQIEELQARVKFLQDTLARLVAAGPEAEQPDQEHDPSPWGDDWQLETERLGDGYA